ncbi:MAG: hypothetical protein WCI51_16360 [Lentisphaerota bacterium]
MSRFKTLMFFTVLLLISVIMLIAINQTEKKLDASIRKNNLYYTGQIRNAPPIVVFTTVALGSFRGLLADVLWLRAASLQEEGNYFEMVQLASWITKLQPRFSGATAYLAWNMAYNISVTCSLPEDRWRWIQEAIKLIRDEALVYNPADPMLYKELGWIFQHKMGNIMDDFNLYYKNRLALEMEQVFGSKPDWQLLASAPRDTSELLKAIPNSGKFMELLGKSKYETLDKLFAEFKKQSKLPPDFVALIDSARISDILDNYFRALWLLETYKLDPALINSINNKYGALDWRTPEAQALYWATKGLEMTLGHRDLSCERMITQALKESFISGRILMIDKDKFERIIMIPNLSVVDSVKRTFEEAYDKNEQQSTFLSAKLNFMQEAIILLYNYGKFAKAAEYYKMLQKEEPGKYRSTLENFVMEQWASEVRDAGSKKATDIISGLIFRSCYFIAYGDDDAALASERMARYIYNTYMMNNQDVQTRTGLASYRDIKNTATDTCIKSLPPVMAEILKARLQEDAARKKDDEKEAKEKEAADKK